MRLTITIAIKERVSGQLVVYEDVQSSQSPWDTVWKCFDGYIKAIIDDVPPGETREYLLFYRHAGDRPICIEAKLINKEMVWEKSVLGYAGPGATGSVPYHVENETPFVAKKGTFPAPPGVGHSLLHNDDGMDDDAIIGAMRDVHQVLQVSLSGEFGETSQAVLLAALGALMRTTGASGDLPRSDCLLDGSAEGSAMLLYDIALGLWLVSRHAADLPRPMKANHIQRLRDEPDHNEQVAHGIAMYRRGI